MATRKTPVPVEKKPVELLASRDDARQRLQERIQKGVELKQMKVNSPPSFAELKHEYEKWNSFNRELLKRIFTNEDFAGEYSRASGIVILGGRELSLGEKISELYRNIEDRARRLDSIIERLELIPIQQGIEGELPTGNAASSNGARSKKVFVVHGRDEIAKTCLEVILHEIGLEPVVLHRQADLGQTVIEKFERHSDVGYVFILLTPDEVAYLRDEDVKPDSERRKEFRARANVIFEFGYFVGKLGRSRVCCLYTGGVSLPSDVAGMIYKKYENSVEEVAYSITKDLRASGYSV